jgi:hypothetical protein
MAMTIGYLESKRAIRIHRQLMKKKGTLFGRSLWARGCCASPVGFDEWHVKAYIKEHEQLQEEQEPLAIDFDL